MGLDIALELGAQYFSLSATGPSNILQSRRAIITNSRMFIDSITG